MPIRTSQWVETTPRTECCNKITIVTSREDTTGTIISRKCAGCQCEVGETGEKVKQGKVKSKNKRSVV